MLEYIDRILVPYVINTRETLELDNDHPALAMFDVFQAYHCDSVLEKLWQHHIYQVFIPAGCTGELQPLDVSFNDELKVAIKSNFSQWYANEIKEALDKGINILDLERDLRAKSTLACKLADAIDHIIDVEVRHHTKGI